MARDLLGDGLGGIMDGDAEPGPGQPAGVRGVDQDRDVHGAAADEPQHAGPGGGRGQPGERGQVGVAHPPVTFQPGDQDPVHRVGADRGVRAGGTVGVPDQGQGADDLDPAQSGQGPQPVQVGGQRGLAGAAQVGDDRELPGGDRDEHRRGERGDRVRRGQRRAGDVGGQVRDHGVAGDGRHRGGPRP